MATNGNDFVLIQNSDPAIVGAGAGNDTYIISAALLNGTERITISDSQGANSIQLVSGLAIASSQVASTALKLTLSNGSELTILGANTFTYEPGGNAVNGINNPDVDYQTFVTGTLGTTVPASGTSTGGPVVIGGPGPATPTFSIVAPNASVAEGASGTWTVTLASPTAGQTHAVTLGTAFVGGASAADIGAITTSAGASLAGNVLTFAAGTTTATLSVPFLTDTVTPETGEGVKLALTQVAGGAAVNAAASSATVSITDVPPGNPTFALSVSATSVNETAPPNNQMTVTLTTTGVAAGTIVNYNVSGNNVNAADFASGFDGAFTVGANGTATATLVLAADATTEGPETFQVGIGVGGVLSPVVTINDTSLTPVGPTPTFSIASVAPAANEGANGTWTVTLANAVAGQSASVQLGHSVVGTASVADIGIGALAVVGAGVFYNAENGVLTFAAGATSATVMMPFLTDIQTPETGEGVTLSLLPITGGAAVSPTAASATVSITDVPPGGPTIVNLDGKGVQNPPAIENASAGAFEYTDSASVANHVQIDGFGADDLIRISGATSAQYDAPGVITTSYLGDVTIAFGDNRIVLPGIAIDSAGTVTIVYDVLSFNDLSSAGNLLFA